MNNNLGLTCTEHHVINMLLTLKDNVINLAGNVVSGLTEMLDLNRKMMPHISYYTQTCTRQYKNEQISLSISLVKAIDILL